MTDTELARLLLEANRALGDEFVEELGQRGYEDVRPGHSAVFMNIDRRSGTGLTELARRARMTKQGMMLLVDELEGRGYARRVPDPEDGRAKIVRLTAKGRRCVAEARRVVAGIEARVRRELGQRQYAAFREALELLAGVGE
jgi:DNA-binding MarR family transcriptional regulator